MPNCGSQITLCDIPIRYDTYKGCSHACSYCFVLRKTDISQIQLGESPRALEEFIKGKRTKETSWCDWDIPLHWGGLADPFQPAERTHRRSLEALKIFARTKYPFVVSTKSTMLAEEPYFSLLKECNCVVQFSACSPKYNRIEKGAATYEQRIAAAAKLSKVCRVNIRIQPYVPSIFQDVIKAIPEYAKAGVHGVILEAMKYTKSNIEGLVSIGSDRCYPVSTLLPQYESIKRTCHKYGLKFYCGENRLRALGDELCCCGIEGMGWRENKANLNHYLFDRENFAYTEKMKEKGTADAWGAMEQTMIKHLEIRESSYEDKMNEYTAKDYAFREANAQAFTKEQGERLRKYLCEALKKSGKTQAEVNKHLGTSMAGHYFGASQWTFPSFEAYKKLREILPLADYDSVVSKIGGKRLDAFGGKIYGYDRES